MNTGLVGSAHIQIILSAAASCLCVCLHFAPRASLIPLPLFSSDPPPLSSHCPAVRKQSPGMLNGCVLLAGSEQAVYGGPRQLLPLGCCSMWKRWRESAFDAPPHSRLRLHPFVFSLMVACEVFSSNRRPTDQHPRGRGGGGHGRTVWRQQGKQPELKGCWVEAAVTDPLSKWKNLNF